MLKNKNLVSTGSIVQNLVFMFIINVFIRIFKHCYWLLSPRFYLRPLKHGAKLTLFCTELQSNFNEDDACNRLMWIKIYLSVFMRKIITFFYMQQWLLHARRSCLSLGFVTSHFKFQQKSWNKTLAFQLSTKQKAKTLKTSMKCYGLCTKLDVHKDRNQNTCYSYPILDSILPIFLHWKFLDLNLTYQIFFYSFHFSLISINKGIWADIY